MSYHRSRKKPFRLTDKELGPIVASIVFAILFPVIFAYNFVANCIVHWPIRWDVGACWHEQVAPAKEKAAETAVNLMP